MKKYIFDNSNIAESYSGVTTPLTYSFARYAYQEVYKHFCRMMGVTPAIIEKNTDMFSRMVVFIGYRMYYDLINWYKLVSFLPGYRFNRGFFEKMLGVQQSYLHIREEQDGFVRKYFIILPRVILQTMGIIYSFIFMGPLIKSFNKRFDRVFGEINAIDLTQLDEDELEALFFRLHKDLVSQWRVPIANDFAVMVSTGIADSLFKKWFPESSVYSFLYSKSHSPLISLDPGLQIVELVSQIKDDSFILSVFEKGMNSEEILRILQQDFTNHPIKLLLEKYLKTFGSRTPNELKLEVKTINERPEILIELLRSLVIGDNDLKNHGQNGRLVQPDFDRIGFLKKIILRKVLDWSINSIARREETRLRRAMIFGFARKIFLALGQRFQKKGALNAVEDIFFLTTEDIFAFVKKSNTIDLKPLVAKRKMEFDSWWTIDTPRRIETSKSIDEIEQELSKQKPQYVESTSLFVKGVVASRPKIDIVSGMALVLPEFDPEANFAGKILVTKQTDPGWTVVFPLLKGLVVERGGMLSHAAIVARELNIPCIVGVDQATSFIKDGNLIRIDLGKGEIHVENKQFVSP